MANIALYPGGYKPPHIGHYKAAKQALKEGADKVIVFVGPKERDGITQNMSITLWELYTQNDPIEIRPAGVSPVRDVYDFVELEAKDGDTLLFIKGKKDSEDPRFARISDYATKVNKNINKDFINIDDIKSRSGKPVSGTSMRSYIKNNDKKSFIDGLPEETDEAAAWNTVTNLDEDLYNPNDHVLDFMKSSEFKAGYTKKDDVPPGYKYRRGGQYSAASGQGGAGTMYEADEKGKTLHAYDFDDTIAQVKANIKTTITSPSGDYNKEILIPAANFPEESKELEARLGSLEIKYDFSEFEKQINDAIVNSKVINKLKSSLSNPQIKTTILTARSIGHPVTRYLKSIGLDAYVVPLGLQVDGKVTGQDKANWIENHIKKGYQTIYFIDDSEENRTAVAALKDKYPDISLTVEDPAAVNEMMGTMNNQEKAKHSKNLKRLKKDTAKQGDQYMEVPKYIKDTLTRKLYEKMSASDVDAVEDFADKKLDPVDVDLTSDHFFDRLNDPRNKKEISGAELIGFFKRLSKRKKEFIEFLKQYKELVVTDDRTNINIPFMKLANKAIAKTVMRKPDFQTSSPSLTLEKNALTKDWWKEQIAEVLTETKANTHLTHLEELVLTQGQDGYNQAKAFLYELIKNLKGEDNTIKNVSVKWDGAPAIFTGINPENGKFFVGTKSVFNVNPKINYTSQDIDTNHGHAAGLAKKLKLALQYLPAVGIKGILQGDFMFDNDDVETEDIDGTPHYTFKPNTIRYAVEANSELGKQIIAARIGIIFHTTYNDLSGGGASFGADVSGLSKSPSVWFDDAFFKDDTGILLSEQEEKFVLERINEADSINVDYTNLPLKNLNTYINSEIRQGEFLDDPSKSFEKFKNWYQQAVDKSIEKVKRPESKERKKQAGEDKLREFNSQKQDIINIFKVSKLLSEAKSIFITKYDKAVATKHFIDNGDGTLSVTKAEGFVAVDHTESGIKLVDRLEFSKNNFNAGKPGEKK